MQNYLIKNISIVNEGRIQQGDVLIKNGRVENVLSQITKMNTDVVEINGEGKFLLPGVIDDQVHFREPGLTHKATIYTEAKAAVAGGVRCFASGRRPVQRAVAAGVPAGARGALRR